MFFNNKENTNIDDQFKDDSDTEKKNNLKKTKKLLFIGGGLLLLIIIIIVIVLLLGKNNSTIELDGEEIITITVGSEYIEPGYKAYDNKNNDITSKVEVSNNIDTSKVGEYEVIYKIGKITKIRYINVVKLPDKSYIYLNGQMNMYLEIGEKYIEPGYKAYDTIDNSEELTKKVEITGTVDTSKKGTYQITYSVTNSRNKTISVTRNVFVVEKGKKTNN